MLEKYRLRGITAPELEACEALVLGEDTSSSEGEAGQPSRKRQKNGTGAEAMQREHVERTEEENEGEGEEMEMEGEEEAVEDPDEDLMADMFMDFGGLPDMEDEEQSISSASSPGTSNEGASEESEGSVPGVPFGAVEELVMEEEEEEEGLGEEEEEGLGEDEEEGEEGEGEGEEGMGLGVLFLHLEEGDLERKSPQEIQKIEEKVSDLSLSLVKPMHSLMSLIFCCSCCRSSWPSTACQILPSLT